MNAQIEFAGSTGVRLAGRLDRPASAPRAFVLFAHCFTCSKDSLATSRISHALVARGFAVLRFDFTGLGGSDGDFANTDFSSNIADLLAAVDWLRSTHQAPSILIGHSLGGAAVLAAASRVPEAVAVVTMGAPFEPAHVTKLLAPALPALAASGEAEIDLAGRRFRIRRELIEDLERSRNDDAIGHLNKALLVMHSPVDATVDIDNARRIFEAARHPKSFVSLVDADHLLTRKRDAQYVADVLAAWASRYLPAEAALFTLQPPGSAVPAPADTQQPALMAATALVPGVRVDSVQGAAFAQSVASGRHRLLGDEPPSVGGTDLGPSPYDFLLAALGTCTSMTLGMYARAKALPLTAVSVELSHSKIHAADCAACETRDGKVDRIERIVTLEGDLTDAQRAKLLEIADKCPVHRTLHAEVSIVTVLAADA